MPRPILKSDVLDLKDLKIGMKLQGTVRNVTPFGAFIDIGLHNDGLAHISKLTNKYIKHPMEIVNVGGDVGFDPQKFIREFVPPIPAAPQENTKVCHRQELWV
jgi:polyribonucleotide nucleotidyltransferase